MSGVSIKKRDQVEFKKYVGFFEGNVVAVNPDMDELESLGITFKDDPEYLKEVEDKDKEGNVISIIKQLAVKFFIKDVKTGNIFNTIFYLKDKFRYNLDGTKRQFINSQGANSWAVDKDKLPEFITKDGQETRVARDGEADLYDFIRTWLSGGNIEELSFDWKKLMSGNVKEISSLIKTEYAKPILCPLTVKITDEGKEYQQIYNKGITGGYLIKQLRLKKIDENYIDQANADKAAKRKINGLQRAVIAITDGEYGCKDTYYLGEMKEYDASENFVASNKVISDEDSSY